MQTRDGRSVRILCYDLLNITGVTIGALIKTKDSKNESWCTYYDNGQEDLGRASDKDLVMASIKKEGWINIYNTKEAGCIYDTKEEALENTNTGLKLKATIKIEWEE